MKISSLLKYCTVVTLLGGTCLSLLPAQAAGEDKAVKEKIQQLEKQKAQNTVCIASLKDLMKDAAIMANPQARLLIYEALIRYTQTGLTAPGRLYDTTAIYRELEPAALAILNDPEIKNGQKFFAANQLVGYYCAVQKYAEADAVAQKVLNFPDLNNNQKASAYDILINSYRYQDRYDDIMKAAREMMKYNQMAGVKKGAAAALAWEKIDDVKAIWDEVNQPVEKYLYFQSNGIGHLVQDEARAYAMNPENPLNKRYAVAASYCLKDMNPRNVAVRESLAGAAAQLKERSVSALKKAFQLGDFPLTVSLCQYYAGSPVMANVAMQKVHVTALAACGKHKEAAELAKQYGSQESLSEIDKMRFRFYEAILSGKNTDKLMKDTTLTRKEQSEVYLSAARQTLTWNMNDLSEKYSQKYLEFFVPREQRSISVRYFDDPVTDISAWRKIYPELEKQYCDIPYRGSMEFLETDVSTGDRDVKINTNSNKSKPLELTTLCDRYGLHIFLRAEAENARAIEHGFARGISTEMYFAPGRNQPYVCIGTSASKGVSFIFHTTYNHKNHTRLDDKKPADSFHSEVEFTDNDYVLHLFFAWDGFYNKLPQDGTNWRFECLAWAPDGGYSWGGSQQIHSASAWGDLCFDLSKENITEIKKQVILKTFRNYRNVR